MTKDHQCPHCHAALQVELPHTDPYGLNKLHSIIHCDTCAELKAKLIKTNDYISSITNELRTAADPAAIEKLSGSLKAHYHGKQRIQKKLDDRLHTSRPISEQNKLDQKPQGQLPW